MTISHTLPSADKSAEAQQAERTWYHDKKREMISHLSLSGYQDSNLGPSGPKPDALTGLRYIPLLYCECKGKAFFLICKLFSKKN